MLQVSKNVVEQSAKLNANLYGLVQEIGKVETIEAACSAVATFMKTQNGTLLAVKFSDWANTQPAIRPHSNFSDSIKAVVEQLKNFDGCPMTQESRIRLAPFSYRSIDRRKYGSLLERRFLQETDKLGYRDIAILPFIAGKGILIATVGLDRIFDEKLRVYSAGVMPHITAAFLANFPQIAKLFDGKLLSDLESGVLTGYSRGLTSAEISKNLKISSQAVPLVINSAAKKLEANNPYQAIHRATLMGELGFPSSFGE